MTLSEMRELLSSRDIRLTKSLGQNFLHDQNQIQRIVALGELRPGDQVVEIGPGLGPLTEALLETGATVLAIEMDRRLCSLLLERFKDVSNFQLIEDDALKYVRTRRRDWTDWKLVSNLPYSVASPLLVEVALAAAPPERLVATLPLEVVERIVARANDDHYGLLSLFLQVRYEPREWFKIPAACFFPAPEVESACVLLRRRQNELLSPEHIRLFQRIVKLAFSARRKMMAKLLKQQWPADQILNILNDLEISPTARAETVSVEQFVEITRLLSKDAERAREITGPPEVNGMD